MAEKEREKFPCVLLKHNTDSSKEAQCAGKMHCLSAQRSRASLSPYPSLFLSPSNPCPFQNNGLMLISWRCLVRLWLVVYDIDVLVAAVRLKSVRGSLIGKISENNVASLGLHHNKLGLIRLGSQNTIELLAPVYYTGGRSPIY